MRNTLAILCLSAVVVMSGCSSRPISKTWGHMKKTYNATKQVYRATKAVAQVVNPLEYIYLSEQGQAVTQQGKPFETQQALLVSEASSGE